MLQIAYGDLVQVPHDLAAGVTFNLDKRDR